MPNENGASQAQQADPTIEPAVPAQADPVDSGAVDPVATEPTAKTYSRDEMDRLVKKRIDKQNAKHRDEVAAVEAERTEAQERAQAAEARVAELEAAKARADAAAKVAAECGLAPEQVALLAGETEEDLKAAAEAFKAAGVPAYPQVTETAGAGKAPVTREEILAIKNTEERVAAMGAHKELFA